MENIRRNCTAEQAGQTVNVENEQTIVVKKAARRKYRTTPIWQYDTGHVLAFEGFELPEWFEVHFARDAYEEAVTQIGQNDQVDLPDMYAQTAGVIRAWMWIADQEAETGLTKFEIEIPVFRRAQPSDVEPTPVEQGVVDQAIAALNAGVTRSETAADAAEVAQAAAELAKAAAQAAADLATEEAAGAAGSERAAAGSAASAAASAEAAAGSAASAAGSAAAAAASATDLETAVTQAQAAATTATGKAQEANYAAQAASGSAGTASTAAARATGAADEAEQSATGAAGSAAAAAGSASAAAGSATTAGAAAATATEKAAQTEQIADEFAEDITDLKSALTQKQDKPQTPGTAGQVLSLDSNLDPAWVDQTGGDESGLAPVIKSTASGEIASFADGADSRNIDSLVVHITPVQDLHGQDAPYPPGGGKNIAYLEQGSLNLDTGAEIASTTRVRTNFIPVEQATTYIASSQNNGWSVRNGAGYDANREYVASGIYPSTNTGLLTVNNASVKFVRFVYSHTTTSESCTPSDYWYQFEKGSTATSYAPYSNICPITGWTGANVTRTGKNLFDKAKMVSGASSSTMRYGAYGQDAYNSTEPNRDLFLYPGDYTFSLSGGNSTVAETLAAYDDTNRLKVVYNNKVISFTVTKASYCRIIFTISTQNFVTWDNYDLMLENGSSATEYVPYQGRTIPVSWESEAGIVFDGMVDIISGLLTVTSKRVDMGSLSWATTNNKFYALISDIKTEAGNGGLTSAVCEIYKAVTYNDMIQNGAVGIAVNNTSALRVYDPSYTTVSEFAEAVNGHYVVYPLAEPIVHQLTPHQLETLLGQNNIFADCGSIASVAYSADTKLYIDGKITAAVAAALNA